MENYQITLTPEERLLINMSLITRRIEKLKNNPCFTFPGCSDGCPVYDKDRICASHLAWIESIRKIDALLYKIGNQEEVEENA